MTFRITLEFVGVRGQCLAERSAVALSLSRDSKNTGKVEWCVEGRQLWDEQKEAQLESPGISDLGLAIPAAMEMAIHLSQSQVPNV